MHFPQLTFTRFLASMCVLFRHFGGSTAVLAIPVIGPLVRNAPSLLGYFFVLAGFVLVVSMARNGVLPPALPAQKFWIRRLTRIYPLHLLALALTIGLQQLLVMRNLIPADSVAAPELGKLLAHALMVHAWYPTPTFALVYNYVSWTLCVELLLMLVAPALYRWFVGQSTPKLLRTVALIWFAGLLVHFGCKQLGVPASWLSYWPPVHVPEFMVGLAGGFVMVRHRSLLEPRKQPIRLITIGCSVLMVTMVALSLPIILRNSLIFAPTFLLIIVNNCLGESWLTRLYKTRLFQYLGELGYGIYILQIPVSLLILRALDQMVDWKYKVLLLLFLTGLVGLAALAYEYVEKPIRAAIDTAFRKRIAATSQPVAITLSADLAIEQLKPASGG